MAYRSYRRRSSRAGYRGRYSRGARRYGRAGYRMRRRRVSRRASQRIVIQVVGGPGGVLTSPATLGKKSARPVRARF